MNHQLVTESWIGDAGDPPAGAHEDLVRAMRLVTATGLTMAFLEAGFLLAL